MTTPKTVILFSNGNTACFNDKGEQIPELQKSWLSTWLEYMTEHLVDPREIERIETIVNGRNVLIKPFMTEDGWNCEIITI